MCRITKPTHTKHRVTNKSHVEILFRVKQFFKKERDEGKRINLNKVLERTVAATGIGRTICSRIQTEDDVTNWPHEDGAKLKYNTESSVPDSYISIVRQVVRDIIVEKETYPTIREVQRRLCELKVEDVMAVNIFENETPPPDSKVWTWSRATLHRFLQASGFVFDDKITHYEYTKQREDVVSMRDNYLEWISSYREKGYEVYYQDETWVFKNMTSEKVWHDTQGDSTKEMSRTPSGSGERSILTHVISENNGLLDGCMLMYRGSKAKQSEDYHSEMNWDVFSDWCMSEVFPAIAATKKSSVLVLDRATYHTKLDDEDRRPVTSWNKARIIRSIDLWGGPPVNWNTDWRTKKTKAQLLEYARSIYPAPKYKIQKMADEFATEEFEIKILFLPVAHPELNPIEMVWSFIKRSVASRNLKFTLNHVENETREQIKKISKEDIAKYASHSRKEEEKYKNLSEVADANC